MNNANYLKPFCYCSNNKPYTCLYKKKTIHILNLLFILEINFTILERNRKMFFI